MFKGHIGLRIAEICTKPPANFAALLVISIVKRHLVFARSVDVDLSLKGHRVDLCNFVSSFSHRTIARFNKGVSAADAIV